MDARVFSFVSRPRSDSSPADVLVLFFLVKEEPLLRAGKNMKSEVLGIACLRSHLFCRDSNTFTITSRQDEDYLEAERRRPLT